MVGHLLNFRPVAMRVIRRAAFHRAEIFAALKQDLRTAVHWVAVSQLKGAGVSVAVLSGTNFALARKLPK